MVKIPPPFFVIRNSRHSSDHSDSANVADVDKADERVDESEFCELNEDRKNNNVPSSIPIVHLVEAPRGMYMLDFCHENDSFMAEFLAENAIRESEMAGGGRTYVDGKAWRHLEAYSLLVGESITKGNEEVMKLNQHEGFSFILLEDAVKDAIHTLLPIDKLFSWKTLVDARNRRDLQWKDIRTFLSQVRNGVPFLTHDGVLRSVVNTHLTFHQFVAFSRLVESHLESIAAAYSPVVVPDVKIYDIFPSFTSMTPEEQKIELLASVKDKASREEARASGVVIPESADELVSITECNEEWRLYVHWWSASGDTRDDFCMRELLFAENNDEVRRNAEKSRVSMRGRHSKDPLTREQFLRRFGSWYLGLDESAVDDDEAEEKIQSFSKPTSLQTYDFATGQNSSSPVDFLSRSSPPKMPNFQNKSWKPSSAAEQEEELVDMQDCDEYSLNRFLVTSVVDIDGSRPSSITAKEAPIVLEMLEDRLPQQKQTRCRDAMAPASSMNNNAAHTKPSGASDSLALIIGTKIKAKEKPPSFRRQFLMRLTSDLDKVTSMLNGKGGSKLRGIELFRSKVRLVIMLRKLTLCKSLQQLEAAAPKNVDIFRFVTAMRALLVVKPKRPVTPKPARPDDRIGKELAERARAHRERVLRKKGFEAISSWRRRMLLKKQRRREEEKRAREEEQRMREEEQRRRERGQRLAEEARRLYERAIANPSKKCIEALRDHARRRKEERMEEEMPPMPVTEEEETESPVEAEEEEEIIAPSPKVKKNRDALGDKRMLDFRSHCSNLFREESPPLLLSELDCMELVVGRSHRSGLDVVLKDEYEEHFASAVELRNKPCRSVGIGTKSLLDKATLKRMKRDKLAGNSNLLDVLQEFIDPLPSSDIIEFNVEYRSSEMVKGLLKQRA